ncbi:glycosyltransferase family 2 protein [Cribrihabitans pelagius]|uniref:glycosyltransferase family 2 protein n=1 Tax=Cribrihabitans pelagius TaxID=1765746 RepID=UPI003B5B065D
MELRLLTVSGLVLLAAAVPLVGGALCGLIIALQLVLIVIRPIAAHLPGQTGASRPAQERPQFSVHVATHAEPPALVIRTLKALLAQDWPANGYEIIVMDNNTADEALWKPVETFCAAHSDRVKFLHRNNVEGAKAGALNIALAHTGPAATHIVTVDADYVVRPDFLMLAAGALNRTGADYVQFPQSYLGAASIASGVDAELEEYFRTNAVVAGEAEAVLLTGTLCVISKTALNAAGGWSGRTTTEDAELGVRLCNSGYAGRFIHQIVGQGLLPFCLKDLEKQRYRWCSGNFQTLLHHFGTILTPNGSLTLAKRVVILSQLTAWLNLALLPCALLLIWLVTGQANSVAAMLAAGGIVLSLCDVVVRVTGRALRDRLAPRVTLHALACRIALAPQSARATFDALCGGRLNFIVTDKSGAKSGARGGAVGGLYLCHSLLFAIAFAVLFTSQPVNFLIVAGLLSLMLPLPAAWITDRSLRSYYQAIVAAPKEVTR